MPPPFDILFTDLDGTLLDPSHRRRRPLGAELGAEAKVRPALDQAGRFRRERPNRATPRLVTRIDSGMTA